MVKGIDYPGVAIIFFCHDGNGKYLMQKRSTRARDEHGCWDVGGGGVKHGELLKNALAREIKEEYGVDIIDFEYLGFREVHRTMDDNQTHWIVFDYKVRVDPLNARVGDPQKADKIGWFSLDGYPKPCHSQLPSTIEKYKQQLIVERAYVR